MSDWFVYMLRCADDTFYGGITTDLERRVREHNGSAKGARYTRSRRPVELLVAWRFDDRSSASKAEHALKKLTRDAKSALASGTSGELPDWPDRESDKSLLST